MAAVKTQCLENLYDGNVSYVESTQAAQYNK